MSVDIWYCDGCEATLHAPVAEAAPLCLRCGGVFRELRENESKPIRLQESW